MTTERTLRDYRPQHDVDCDSHNCSYCGKRIEKTDHWSDTWPVCMCFPPLQPKGPKPCTCGLDALLTASAGASPSLPPCVNGECLYSCSDDECKKAVEKGIPWPAGASPSMEKSRGQHGVDCVKVPHLHGTYLHADNDDGPYELDNVQYCGRCHAWMGTQIVVIDRASSAPQVDAQEKK